MERFFACRFISANHKKAHRHFPQGERGDRTILTHPLSLAIVAFGVTRIPACLLTKMNRQASGRFVHYGRGPADCGVVMWIVDELNSASEAAAGSHRDANSHVAYGEDMSVRQAVWIGACQILSAVFPGLHGPMSTIAAGTVGGNVAGFGAGVCRFSSRSPRWCVATCYDLPEILRGKGENAMEVTHIESARLGGAGDRFVGRYRGVRGGGVFFFGVGEEHGFAPFADYRIIVGAAVFYWASRLGE